MKVYPISIEVYRVDKYPALIRSYGLLKMSCGCESEFCVEAGAASSGEAHGQLASTVTITDRVESKNCQRKEAAIPHEEEFVRTNLLVLQAVVTKALMLLPVTEEMA